MIPFLKRFGFATITLLLSSAVYSQTEDKKEQNRFEKDIVKFENSDRENPPTKREILFLGSSSIRLWDLEKWFPNQRCINRGFGGSQISDSNHFFDRVVKPYEPRAIVMYAGDNDLAAGKSPAKVVADFKLFLGKVKSSLPSTRVIFIAIKPSIARWNLVDEVKEANKSIQSLANDNPNLDFADIQTPMLGKDGRPIKELFRADGLHLNEKGYQVWFKVVSPMIAGISKKVPGPKGKP